MVVVAFEILVALLVTSVKRAATDTGGGTCGNTTAGDSGCVPEDSVDVSIAVDGVAVDGGTKVLRRREVRIDIVV